MALSAKVTTTCSGEYDNKSACSFLASSKARASDPGRCTVSASVNNSHSARASFVPATTALFFPVQHFPVGLLGTGPGEMTRTPAKRFAISRVRSAPPTARAKTPRDFARAVGGAVVDHDDLESHAGLGGQ